MSNTEDLIFQALDWSTFHRESDCGVKKYTIRLFGRTDKNQTIYVEIIENKCEGMVRIRDIKEDYFTFDEKQYALVGATSHSLLQLGDEVFVKVKTQVHLI